MRYTHADPTANAAIAHVDREFREAARRRAAAERIRRMAKARLARTAEEQEWYPDGRIWTLAWTDKQGRL